MANLIYIEKPENVSWDAIQNCITKAHSVNAAKGFRMTSQNLTGEKLSRKLRDGKCFLALDGDNVVGTASVRFVQQKRWWNKGTVAAYFCHDGVLPEYQGQGVFKQLNILREKYVKNMNVNIIQINTAEANNRVQEIHLLNGFKYVQYSATGKGADYYSVIMAKWCNGCPYSDLFCNSMFKLSKFLIKGIWKPGYKIRFFS